jgi:6-phosphogluconolactonase
MMVTTVPDADALAWEAASQVAAAARAAVQARGRFTLAISGGHTPLALFRLLALGEWVARVPWEQTELFWADERCVPPDSPDSNYGAVRALLLDRIPLPPDQVHRWQGEAPDPAAEAAHYAAVLRARVPELRDGMPRLDLILLGMGPDGHTASLFPRSPALAVTDRPTAVNPPGLPPLVERLTLTYPALNAARAVTFLVEGSDKAATLARVLAGPHTPADLPAQGVRPADGTLTWLVDAAAAAALRRP